MTFVKSAHGKPVKDYLELTGDSSSFQFKLILITCWLGVTFYSTPKYIYMYLVLFVNKNKKFWDREKRARGNKGKRMVIKTAWHLLQQLPRTSLNNELGQNLSVVFEFHDWLAALNVLQHCSTTGSGWNSRINSLLFPGIELQLNQFCFDFLLYRYYVSFGHKTDQSFFIFPLAA